MSIEATHKQTEDPNEYLILVDGEAVGKLAAGWSYGDDAMKMRMYQFTPSRSGYTDWPAFGAADEAGALLHIEACVCWDATRLRGE